MNLKTLFSKQLKFNDLFYQKKLTEKEKEEITKSLILALHSEVSSLADNINFKDHKINRECVDLSGMLYESVDVLRYLIAILNLWDFSSDDLVSAYKDKELFLHARHRSGQNKWCGEPVIIVDIDDVIAQFREYFVEWLEERHGVVVDKNSPEYYTSTEVKNAGLNPEGVFFQFIDERQFREIRPCIEMLNSLKSLKREGYWIHLLTARPSDNLIVKYDTYSWIEMHKIPYDRIDFSPEKYRWIAQSEYYDTGKIVCAIDDSPKHAAEIAKHGIPVIVPRKSYNQEVLDVENIEVIDSCDEVLKLIKSFSN